MTKLMEGRKGDSGKMPGGVCSNCLGSGIDCMHENMKKSRSNPVSHSVGLPKHSPLAETSLEFFQQHSGIRATVAAILSSTTPYAIPREFSVIRLTMVELASYIDELEKALAEAASPPSLPGPASSTAIATATPNDQDTHNLRADLTCTRLQSMKLDYTCTRFYGPSSNLMLLKPVMDVRDQFLGDREVAGYPRRAQYWRTHPWQIVPSPLPVPLVFPEPDLLRNLTDLYFLHHNQYLPLFHKPTFDRLVSEKTHLANHQFGMIVLGVIAIGARYSDDPRVLQDEVDSGQSELGVGWKYYRQISLAPTSYIRPTTIYELQLYCICILYLQGTSTPENSWIYLGIAVRCLQDIGLHRKAPNAVRSTENELAKRAFWVIICIDILLSAFLGRPRATNPDEYDQDLPADCDDEYWDHSDPEQAFKQPAGKPSTLTAFLTYMKLLNILAVSQRTIYSVNKSGDDTLPKSDINEVVKVDSVLNAWVDSLPAHLKWDPHRENITFFNQSCILYVTYYYTQLLVHKPFIPSPESRPMANMSFPSLAICANAARSCCHVMDVQSRKSFLPLHNVMIPLASSALILLLNHWGGRRLGVSCNSGQEYADVYKCLSVLRLYEKRWQVAGRLCDLIEQLLNFGAKTSVSMSSLKRSRDSEDTQETYETQVPQASSVSAPEDNTGLMFYNLPFSTNELGQLPVHGSFDFTDREFSAPIVFEDPELVHILDSMDPPSDVGFVPMFPQGEAYSGEDWSLDWLRAQADY
ncbi:fungal-specific transcription factor domain-containing protein [Mycena floridula]|nr:fungal-specific transcription factor domain-containing protein [Mycena floridula]